MKRLNMMPVVMLLLMAACNTPLPVPTLPPAPPSPTLNPVPVIIAMPTSSIPAPLGTTPGAPGTLSTALEKARSAQKYRVALTLDVQQPNTPHFVLSLSGEINGADAHYAYRLSSDQVEFIMAHGQAYAKGARSVGLPTMNKWYLLQPDLADVARPPFSPQDLMDDFSAQKDKVGLQPEAREPLDGQNCQVWRSLPKSLADTGIGSALGLDQDTGPFAALDQAEVKAWLCDDGVLHQLGIDITAHNPRQVTEKGTAKFLLHLWDFQNAAIKIDAPANAEPFRVGTPTR
jgi:hypothetical protein